MQTDTTQIQPALFIKMVISNWELQNTRFNELLDKLSDEELAAEAAPGRNTGVYLLGHLTAISDAMIPLLNLGDKLYPELYKIFVETPDKSGLEFPTIAQLKEYWHKVNETLGNYFSKMGPAEWFTKHMSISEENFAKEPHRNKLNILINRTNHQSSHYGQMLYLKR